MNFNLWAVPAALLVLSNTFMTFAWYGHLKTQKDAPIWMAIAASWGIALFEYILMVPANRIGNENGLSTGQLKIMQEMITLVVFAIFSMTWLKEAITWRYFVACMLVLAGVVVMFWDKK